ncbi:hypothetical protein Goklo_000268, partial [Gossypium klotzschianum]|nr:hypothetical protein [Gossypium klotzschianum]
KYTWYGDFPQAIRASNCSLLWLGISHGWEKTVSNEHVSTAEMINECGEWDWNRLHALLPDEILRRFAAKRSPMMVMLTTFLDGVGINITESSKTPCSCCRYAACGNGVKTIDHVLRFCFLTMSVWLLLIRPEKLYKFMSMSIEEWLFANITDAEQLALDPDNWACMFEALCWCLWKQRNSRIFIQGHVDQDNVVNGARQLCSVQAASADWLKVNTNAPLLMAWLEITTDIGELELLEISGFVQY